MSKPDADADVETPSFPYELLPNEMKVPILENIGDPQDKLNILEVLPSTEWLMGWDCTSLKFELVYPLVFQYLKWPHEKKTRSWKNLLNLCKVSPEFQRIVTSHFEKYITSTHNTGNPYFRDYRQEPILTGDSLKAILKAASDKTSPPWHTAIPFMIATGLYKRCQVPFLTKLGKKMWSLGLSLLGAYTIPGTIDYLVECLRLVPNLRRLNVADFYPPEFSQYDLPPAILHEDCLVLPELPDLKMISLMKDCNKFQQWVLPKYTRQLEVMDFEDCFLTENFNPTCFPKVEAINIKFTLDPEQGKYLNASIENVNGLLNKFLLSPLKTITVILEEVNVAKFFNFMLTLNNFGNTLDTLEMRFGYMNAEMEDEVENELDDWISQLNFPKMSCLHLGCYVGPLELILKMPALKKLNIVTDSLQPLKLSSEKGLKFTVKQQGMLESPIWQRFPLLDWLQVDFTVYQEMDNMDVGDPNGRPSAFYLPFRRYAYNITRQMYERHQKK